MQSSSSHLHLPFPRVGLEAAAAANAYPSLERSTKKRPLPPTYNSAMANRELPALPNSTSSRAKATLESARSMEDLESLEAAGIHGRSKMHYREVGGFNGAPNAAPTFADAMLQASSTANSLSHRLRSADEYPAHHSPGSALPPSMSGHNILGIRPLEAGGPYPTSLRASNSTLLPGQTYPESSAKPLPAIASLQDMLFHHHQKQSAVSVNSTSTSSIVSAASSIGIPFGGSGAKKRTVETTFGLNDTVKTSERDSTPPPLFPKQYHQVVEQRRRSSLSNSSGHPLSPPSASSATSSSATGVPVPPRSIVSESPAVNRRVKPAMSTPPAPPLPPTPSSSVAAAKGEVKARVPSPTSSAGPPTPSKASVVTVNSSLNSPAASSESGATVPSTEIVPGKFVAYRESSKPFEMSDFYKYSTKYRKTSVSSLGEKDANAGGSGSGSSPRSSTASGNGSTTGPLTLATMSESPQRPPKPSSRSNNNAEAGGGDLGEDFSNEMLAWYDSTQEKVTGGGSATRPTRRTPKSSSSSSSLRHLQTSPPLWSD